MLNWEKQICIDPIIVKIVAIMVNYITMALIPVMSSPSSIVMLFISHAINVLHAKKLALSYPHLFYHIISIPFPLSFAAFILSMFLTFPMISLSVLLKPLIPIALSPEPIYIFIPGELLLYHQ